MTSTYKALTYQTSSTPLKWTTRTLSELKPSEVLVKIKAVSVNPVDTFDHLLASSFYKGDVVKTFGSDFSGVVEKAGTESGFEVGDKVFGDALDNFGERGSFAEYIQMDPKDIMYFGKFPHGMTFEQAAAVPLATGTAYETLTAHTKSLEGGSVLVLGGGTSVGLYAIQFAKNFFKVNKVVATCSPGSDKRVKAMGADVTVDYSKGDTAEINGILEIVKEDGHFDLVVDCVRDSSIYRALGHVVKPASEGGLFNMVVGMKSLDSDKASFLGLIPPVSFLVELLKEKLGISKLQVALVAKYQDDNVVPTINKLWKDNQFKVPIDSVYNIETEYDQAITKTRRGKAKGKVVLKFE